MVTSSKTPYSKTWLVFVLVLGVLATALPLFGIYRFGNYLRARPERYTESIREPTIVEGQVSRLDVEPDGYRISFLYPTLDLDGETVWRSHTVEVSVEYFETLATGDPITIVYSAYNPKIAYLYSEVLEPQGNEFLPIVLILLVLGANGVALIAWSANQLRIQQRMVAAGDLPAEAPEPLDAEHPTESGRSGLWRRITIGGWASALAFSQLYLLARYLALGDYQSSGALIFFLYMPGLAVPYSLRPFGGEEAGLLLINLAYWLLVGGLIILLIKSNWRRVVSWLIVLFITMAVGFYFLILAISSSSP